MTQRKKRFLKAIAFIGTVICTCLSFFGISGFINQADAENTANVTLPYNLQTTNWATAPTYGATTPITVTPVEETLKDGNKLYGYKLSSGNTYSSAVMQANTSTPLKNAVTGEPIVVNGYSMPYCQDLTFSIEQAINTDADVEFLMSPMVKGGQGMDFSTRFVMALSDAEGQVHGLTSKTKNGFNTNGNFLSWEFANDSYSAYDNRQQMNGPKVWETNSLMKAESERTGTTVGQYSVNGTTTDMSSTEMADSWVSNAFYGLPEYRNSTANDAVNYNGSEIFVRVRMSFTETVLTVTFDHVYKDAIYRECSYATHETNCKFTRTYDISQMNFSDDLKLYFGYYNTNVRFTESQIGQSGVNKHAIPMSLGIYNYKNGAVRDLAVNQEDKVLFLQAGEEFNLSNIDVDVTYFDGMDVTDGLSLTFESEDTSRIVIQDGKIKVLPNAPSGYATVKVKEEGGKSDTISVMILSGGRIVDLSATDKGLVYFGNKTPVAKGDEFVLSYSVDSATSYAGEAEDKAYFSVVSLNNYSQIDLKNYANRSDIALNVNGENKPMQDSGRTKLPDAFFADGASVSFVFLPDGTDTYSWFAMSGGVKIAEGSKLPYNKGLFAIAISGVEFRATLNNVVALSGETWSDNGVDAYAQNKVGTENATDNRLMENTAIVYDANAVKTSLTIVAGGETYDFGERYISDETLKILSGATKDAVYKIGDKRYNSVAGLTIGNNLTVEIISFAVQNSVGAAVNMLPEAYELRFSATLNVASMESWFTYGMLVTETDKIISADEFTHEYLTANAIAYEDMKAEDCMIVEQTADGIKYSFVKEIADENIAESYAVRAYVKVALENGEYAYFYSNWNSEDQSRSAYQAAKLVKETYDYKGTAKKSLESYIGKVLPIDSQGNLAEDRPYTISLSKGDNGLTIINVEAKSGSTFDISTISCLIWDGDIIKDADWSQIEDGKIVCDMSMFGGATLWMNGQTELAGPYMDFVWQTQDGTLIVIDGGTPDSSLEDYIVNNAKGDSLKDGKPYVEAIFVTHAHSDHIDAITAMINNYENNHIEIGTIYMNLPSWEWMDAVEGTSTHRINFKQALETAQARGVKVIMDLALGSQITIDELTFKILYVVDETLTTNGINNASMIIKVITPKMSVLFLGDMGVEAGYKLLNSQYASEVKSDVVQMAHHGQSGVDKTFYEAVQASVALWNCPDYVWSVYESHYWLTTLETRAWMAELGCEINYVAKDGDIVLE